MLFWDYNEAHLKLCIDLRISSEKEKEAEMFHLTLTRNGMPSLTPAIRAFGMLLAIMLAGGVLWVLAASDHKIVYAEVGGGAQTTAVGASLPYPPGAPDCGPDWAV